MPAAALQRQSPIQVRAKKAVVSDAAKTKPSLRIIPLRKSGSLNAVEKEEQICLDGDKLLSYSSYKRMYEDVLKNLASRAGTSTTTFDPPMLQSYGRRA